jgi:hypothetical protein
VCRLWRQLSYQATRSLHVPWLHNDLLDDERLACDSAAGPFGQDAWYPNLWTTTVTPTVLDGVDPQPPWHSCGWAAGGCRRQAGYPTRAGVLTSLSPLPRQAAALLPALRRAEGPAARL